MSEEEPSQEPKICCPVCGEEVNHLWYREVVAESGSVYLDREDGLDWLGYEGDPYDTLHKEFCCPECDAKLFSNEGDATDFVKRCIDATPTPLRDDLEVVKKLRELLAKCHEVERLAEELKSLAENYEAKASVYEGFSAGLRLSRGEGCDCFIVEGEGGTLVVSEKRASLLSKGGEGLEEFMKRLEKIKGYVDEKIKELESVASTIKTILATANLFS
jgi:hypothetical protein